MTATASAHAVAVVPDKNRALVSTRPIARFQPAIAFEPALAYIALDDNLCAYSLARPPNLQSALPRCSKCRHSRFASQHEQRLAWTSAFGFKQECVAISNLTAAAGATGEGLPPLGLLIRLAARIVWTLPSSCTEALSTGDLPVSVDESAMVLSKLVRAVATIAADTPDATYAPEAAAVLLGQLRCNVFQITDPELKPVGIGLFSAACLLNHSESPNCMPLFNLDQVPPRVSIVALRDILPHEELTITYAPLFEPFHVRRQTLCERYGFRLAMAPGSATAVAEARACDIAWPADPIARRLDQLKCAVGANIFVVADNQKPPHVCIHDPTGLLPSPEERARLSQYCRQFAQAVRGAESLLGQHPRQALQLAQQVLTTPPSAYVLGPHHSERLRLHSVLSRAYLAVHDFAMASEYQRRVVHTLEAVCSDPVQDLDLALHRAVAAKLSALGQPAFRQHPGSQACLRVLGPLYVGGGFAGQAGRALVEDLQRSIS
jgi:hypothetical protein